MSYPRGLLVGVGASEIDAKLARRGQTLALGLTPAVVRRRVKMGRLERLEAGVYPVRGAPSTWRQQVLAACLALGPSAFVSHTSAAALWQLPTGGAIRGVEVTVPVGSNHVRAGHRVSDPQPRVWTWSGSTASR